MTQSKTSPLSYPTTTTTKKTELSFKLSHSSKISFRACWTWAAAAATIQLWDFQGNTEAILSDDGFLTSVFRKFFTLSDIFLVYSWIPWVDGWLVWKTLQRLLLFICHFVFNPHIKMPDSAGYHGASSLLSAHFSPADFSSWIFISAFLPVSSLQSLSLFVLPSWFHFREQINPS